MMEFKVILVERQTTGREDLEKALNDGWLIDRKDDVDGLPMFVMSKVKN